MRPRLPLILAFVLLAVRLGVAAEEPLKKSGLVLKNTRMLDPVTETVVQEWGPKA